MTLTNIKAPKNGYAYVYISNQSNNDVYFDNLQVQVAAGNIIEENHYYAYGLKIATLSSKKLGNSYEGALKNNYLYNDKELFDDADLNWYDYGFRNYDPQIGRFTQLDPLADDFPFLTPYQYASCEPIANIDLDGLEKLEVIGRINDAVVTASSDLMEVVITAKPAVKTVEKVKKGFLWGVGRFFKGVYEGAKETVVFAVNVFNPDPEKNSIVQTGKFIYNVVTDPVGTGKAILEGIKQIDWRDPATYGKILISTATPGSIAKSLNGANKLSKAKKLSSAGKAKTIANTPDPPPVVPKNVVVPKGPKGPFKEVTQTGKSTPKRLQYMGNTPGKNSATGKKVIERMRTEGKIRQDFDGNLEFQASDGKWYPIDEADMSHKVDAVKWWNETGRHHGAKSREVRNWMLDPNNYELDHFHINRSKGASLSDRYLLPDK